MRERTGQARPGRADQHCRLTAVNFSQHSERQRDLSQPQSDLDMADIVKSSYVVDPDDQMRLIRREEDGREVIHQEILEKARRREMGPVVHHHQGIVETRRRGESQEGNNERESGFTESEFLLIMIFINPHNS